MPLDNLDDYSPMLVEAGGGGSPPVMTAGTGGSSGGLPGTPPENDPSAPGTSGGSAAGGSIGGGSNSSGGSNSAGASNGTGGMAGANGSGTGSGNGGDGSPDAGTSPEPEEPTPEEPAGPSLCADGELEGPDDDCFFLDARTQSFFAARSACQARGSGWDLASIRSAEASTRLGDALTFEGWLVGSDVASEGNWVWLDDRTPFWQGGAAGTPVAGAYGNWNSTEPNGGGTTNCLRALPRSAGSANPDAPWADLGCTELRGGICRGPRL